MSSVLDQLNLVRFYMGYGSEATADGYASVMYVLLRNEQ